MKASSRNWVTQAEVDEGRRPGVTAADSQRIVELERENRELRRANHITENPISGPSPAPI